MAETSDYAIKSYKKHGRSKASISAEMDVDVAGRKKSATFKGTEKVSRGGKKKVTKLESKYGTYKKKETPRGEKVTKKFAKVKY